MNNKEKIKLDLKKVNMLVSNILTEIKNENKDGKQFDYCTDGELSDLASSVESKVAQIYGIVYQDA